jgi:hypothetical protein
MGVSTSLDTNGTMGQIQGSMIQINIAIAQTHVLG